MIAALWFAAGLVVGAIATVTAGRRHHQSTAARAYNADLLGERWQIDSNDGTRVDLRFHPETTPLIENDAQHTWPRRRRRVFRRRWQTKTVPRRKPHELFGLGNLKAHERI
jgi:hypothetical protein